MIKKGTGDQQACNDGHHKDQIAPESIGFSYLTLEGRGDPAAARNLGYAYDRYDGAGKQQGPNKIPQLLLALKMIGHHEIDDHVLKILEYKKETCLQVQPSENRTKEGGNQADDDVVCDRLVERRS